MSKPTKEYLKKWFALSERFYKIGIEVNAFDPGISGIVVGRGGRVDVEPPFLGIVDDLIKKAYPETTDEDKMAQLHKVRRERMAKEYKVAARIKESKLKGLLKKHGRVVLVDQDFFSAPSIKPRDLPVTFAELVRRVCPSPEWYQNADRGGFPQVKDVLAAALVKNL